MNKKKPTFEQAMNISMFWCNAWEEGEISDEVLADRVGELLESKDGARGFFVISLSDNCPLLDRLPEPLIFELIKGGVEIIDLIIKNMAMSSAMSLHHKRNKDEKLHCGSERVKRRCIELLQLLDSMLVKEKLESLINSLLHKGEYEQFLQNHNYDDEQKKSILLSINLVANS